MLSHCINCKREIAKGQQHCPLCGSPQSYLNYYKKSILFGLVLFGGMAAASFWYIKQQAHQHRLDIIQLTENQVKRSEGRVQELERQLQQIKQKLVLAEQQTSVAQMALSKSVKAVTEIQVKLNDAEKIAIKAEGRASWLNKENKRFKAELKSLTNRAPVPEQSLDDNNEIRQETAKPPVLSTTD